MSVLELSYCKLSLNLPYVYFCFVHINSMVSLLSYDGMSIPGIETQEEVSRASSILSFDSSYTTPKLTECTNDGMIIMSKKGKVQYNA